MPGEIEEKTTVDTILDFLRESVEKNRTLNPAVWLDAAFKLNLKLGPEHDLLEDLRVEVAKKKLEIMKAQDKRNVSAADLEIEASDEYKAFRLQEHKVDRVEEFIKIAKKNGSSY